jgi:hypothetical protein
VTVDIGPPRRKLVRARGDCPRVSNPAGSVQPRREEMRRWTRMRR